MQCGRYLRQFAASDGEIIGYTYYCPGCKGHHSIWVKSHGAVWQFNGDFDKPTFSPSIRVHGNPHCHHFIKDGNIEFCTDSAHALAGKTVPLPENPEVDFYADKPTEEHMSDPQDPNVDPAPASETPAPIVHSRPECSHEACPHPDVCGGGCTEPAPQSVSEGKK